MLIFLDFLTVAFVAETNSCIKQALLKWSQKSHQLASIRITQKLRDHDMKKCFFSIITKTDCSSYCMYIFDPADLVTFKEVL